MILFLVPLPWGLLHRFCRADFLRWPAPLYNLYFDSFLLICTSFVVKTRGIVCVVYPLSRLAKYRDPCKRCVLADFLKKCRGKFEGFNYEMIFIHKPNLN